MKQQTEALIKQRKLQQFISKERTDPPQEKATRRMIIGGTTSSGSFKKAHKTYLRMVQSI